MRDTPAGIADVVRTAEVLGLRGAALAAVAEMFGLTLRSGTEPAPPPPPVEPPPRTTGDDSASTGALAGATDVLPPSVRRLEAVRQGTAPETAWTDPIGAVRPPPADREVVRLATCRINLASRPATGYLIAGNRVVTCSHIMLGHGTPPNTVTIAFPGREEMDVKFNARASDVVDVAVLNCSEPIRGIAPLTFGRAIAGSWEGYGYPLLSSREGLFMSGTVLEVSGPNSAGQPSLLLRSDQISASAGGWQPGLFGMPIVQGGRVVGHLSGTERPSDVFATRAEEIIASLLPDERQHPPASSVAASRPLPFEGLFERRDAVALLRHAVSLPIPSDRLDVARIVHDLARARPMQALPRLRVPSMALGAQLLVDVGQPMQSFWDDQQEFVERFRGALRGLADVRFVGDDPRAGAGPDRRRGAWSAYELPQPGLPVIALTDLGCGFPPRSDASRAWIALAAALRRRGSRLIAFAPVRLPRVPLVLRRAVDLVIWDRLERRRSLSRLTRLSDG